MVAAQRRKRNARKALTQLFHPNAGVSPTPFSSRFSGSTCDETPETAAANKDTNSC